MEFFDSHCHLNYDYAPKSADQLVVEAQAAGVATLITVATDLPSLEAVVAISERHARVFHTAGIHPHEATTETTGGPTPSPLSQPVESLLRDGSIEKLRQAIRHPKCVAVGELGLDTHYTHSTLAEQLGVLDAQLELALEASKPVVVHSREAEPELLERLRIYAGRVGTTRSPGVIHCFTGTAEFARECLDLGFYLSFSGILTFKSAEDLRLVAKSVPLDRILIETDAPFLAPIPFRGKKAEPIMVKQTGQKLAEIKGISIDEVAAVTTANAHRLFGISPLIAMN